MASAAKLAVSETIMTKNALPTSQGTTGYTSPKATENVASITVADDGTGAITVTYTAVAGGGTIVLVPTVSKGGDVSWTCTSGTLPAKYRPSSCR